MKTFERKLPEILSLSLLRGHGGVLQFANAFESHSHKGSKITKKSNSKRINSERWKNEKP